MIESVRKTIKLYKGTGWPWLFTNIRFFTANFISLEKYVPKKGKILDLGCGYGIFVNYLALTSSQRSLIGIELDEAKLKYADQGIVNTSFIEGDATKLLIPKVDCILLIHVLHHLDSYSKQEKLIESCYNKLKKTGMLLVAEIDCRPAVKYILTQIADHILYPADTIYYRNRSDFKKLFENKGFKVKDLAFHQKTPFSHVLFLCKK